MKDKNKIFNSDLNQLDQLDQIQKNIEKTADEIKSTLKIFKENKIDNKVNELYECFHNHIAQIHNNIQTLNHLLYNMNELKNPTKNNHELGLILGFELFRLKKYVETLDKDDSTNKRIVHSIKRLEESFLSQGYRIKDYTNDKFIIENNLKVVNRIEDKNLKKGSKIITRMIKPTIYFNNAVLKAGEVEIKVGIKKGK